MKALGSLSKMGIISFCVLAGTFTSFKITQAAQRSKKDVSARHEPSPETCAPGSLIGSTDAPLLMKVIFSFSCSHCAEFHEKTLPQLKKTYIDTGKLRVELIDFPLDKYALKASLIARCRTVNQYKEISDILLQNQSDWLDKKDPAESMINLLVRNGIELSSIKKCLKDKTLEDQVLETCVTMMKAHKVDSTPTLILDKKVIPYAADFEELSPLIDAAYKKVTKQPAKVAR